MNRFKSLVAAMLAMFVSAPAHAYWEYGHQTIADIAYANVRPTTRIQIRRLLAQSALLDTPQCPARTIKDASVWADCVKQIKNPDGTPKFGYAYTWHFQDVEVCEPFSLTAACKDGNCVSAQIDRDVATLRNPHSSAVQRVQALVYLIHFVGDLHQPLHAGEKMDKGGNDVRVSYGVYAPNRLNLHSVWDGLLAERAITTGPSLVRRYPATVRAKIAAGSVTDWSRESWQIARDDIYGKLLGGDPCAPTPAKIAIGEATIEAWVPVARLEIERGGLRLAKLLDRALS